MCQTLDKETGSANFCMNSYSVRLREVGIGRHFACYIYILCHYHSIIYRKSVRKFRYYHVNAVIRHIGGVRTFFMLLRYFAVMRMLNMKVTREIPGFLYRALSGGISSKK